MTQLTIRGIDPRAEQQIRKMAGQTGKSLNQVVLDMIHESTGHRDRRKTPCASLKNLAVGWSEEDANDFFESIKLCEQIDGSIWE